MRSKQAGLANGCSNSRAMTFEAKRTLVKSAPELWQEISEPENLSRHLGQFQSVMILEANPQFSVDWMAQGVRGKVVLEPSGWGTRVTVTATPAAIANSEAQAATEQPTKSRQTLGGDQVASRRRFLPPFLRRSGTNSRTSTPASGFDVTAISSSYDIRDSATSDQGLKLVDQEITLPDTQAALNAALDSLGAAHHRPFSRS